MKFLFLLILLVCLPANALPLKSEFIPIGNIQEIVGGYSHIISNSSFKISAIDSSNQNNPRGSGYPGLRGANQLVVYTPCFDLYGGVTGTNEYGKEAIVQNGIVTSFSGSNSVIPHNGFVISGHGSAKNWIAKHLMVGAKISIDYSNNTVKSVITPDSYVYLINQKKKRIKQIMARYKGKGVSFEQAEVYLKQANDKIAEMNSYIAKKDMKKAVEKANEATTIVDRALSYAIPSKADEVHGVWVRPVEKNKKEIINTLNEMKKTGVSDIFLETYYQGSTVYPSKVLEKYKINHQRAELMGWNPLKIWVEEAHKRDMRLHAWFQTFYAGQKKPTNIVSIYPTWANVQRRYLLSKVPVPSRAEHQGFFLDPANPNVQKFLLELLEEIATDYKVDGISLDYIRYPLSIPEALGSDWGYSETARQEFIDKFGMDPAYINPVSPMAEEQYFWELWSEYKQKKVTDFVKKAKATIDCVDGDIELSAVIFADATESKRRKMQNWHDWAENQYIDAFIPLVMNSDDIIAKKYTGLVKNKLTSYAKVYPTLFEPFINAPFPEMLYQMEAIRSECGDGVLIFDWVHMDKNYRNALKNRAFRI